jgi:hypothetical protein
VFRFVGAVANSDDYKGGRGGGRTTGERQRDEAGRRRGAAAAVSGQQLVDRVRGVKHRRTGSS